MQVNPAFGPDVHCRIGSLEMPFLESGEQLLVHCRIGSLEIYTGMRISEILGSLPHRQFRKRADSALTAVKCSLPHRQFRNFEIR